MMSKTTKIFGNRKHKIEKNRLQKYSRLSRPIFAPTTLQSYLSSFGSVMYV